MLVMKVYIKFVICNRMSICSLLSSSYGKQHETKESQKNSAANCLLLSWVQGVLFCLAKIVDKTMATYVLIFLFSYFRMPNIFNLILYYTWYTADKWFVIRNVYIIKEIETYVVCTPYHSCPGNVVFLLENNMA